MTLVLLFASFFYSAGYYKNKSLRALAAVLGMLIAMTTLGKRETDKKRGEERREGKKKGGKTLCDAVVLAGASTAAATTGFRRGPACRGRALPPPPPPPLPLHHLKLMLEMSV